MKHQQEQGIAGGVHSTTHQQRDGLATARHHLQQYLLQRLRLSLRCLSQG
jgi:hypothetical protein